MLLYKNFAGYILKHVYNRPEKEYFFYLLFYLLYGISGSVI